ncbi:hypothetical protein BJ170DRAFT_679803 [Xylariales sp. AK1849]|nr:hypothetical protein BJ170DRAFT_679803 [Xylariales sp. AK1849]
MASCFTYPSIVLFKYHAQIHLSNLPFAFFAYLYGQYQRYSPILLSSANLSKAIYREISHHQQTPSNDQLQLAALKMVSFIFAWSFAWQSIVMLALIANVSAYKATFLADENGCSSPQDSYYIYSAEKDKDATACQNLGHPPNGPEDCAYFTHGGREGPFPCDGTHGDFTAQSMRIVTSFCTVFGESDCGGTGHLARLGACENNIKGVKSFICSWTDPNKATSVLLTAPPAAATGD